jgi:hypothetical protein
MSPRATVDSPPTCWMSAYPRLCTIARSWGLVASFEKRPDQARDLTLPSLPDPPEVASPMSGIQKTIEDALRAAGLMK